MPLKFILLFVMTFSYLFGAEKVAIGVLTFKNKAQTLKQWEPMAQYLNKMEPRYSFSIVPLSQPEINEAVKNSAINFVVTHPGHYVYLEKEYRISRIATMIEYKHEQWLERFGGVIFTRANRADIKKIEDLKGKKIAATQARGFGGYAVQMYEFFKNNIFAEDLEFAFTGMPQQNVVRDVISGKADAGFVRTDVLETMAQNEELDLNSIKIINQKNRVDFPYMLSTELYPGWPIAQLANPRQDLSNEVVIALLQLVPHNNAKNGDIGWSAPLEYRDVHDIYQVLRLAPYDKARGFTINDIYEKYRLYIWTSFVLLILIFIGIVIEFTLRRRLSYESQKNQAFLHSSADGIHILNEDGKLVQVSDKFCSMLGYTREEMTDMSVSEWDDALPLETIQANLQKLSQKNERIQTRHRRKDGTLYDVEINLSVIHVGKKNLVYCSARDITEQLLKEAQRELAALVYENSSDAILISDSEAHIVSLNPAFTLLTGYSLADIKGETPHILSSGNQNSEFYHQMWESLSISGNWEGEIVDVDKEGNVFSKWLSIRTLFDHLKNPYRRIAIFSEITDQKEVKKELWYQANFDGLTGLCNRKLFMYRLEKELDEIGRSHKKMALLFLDLDNFKDINDTLGHDKGDVLLKEAANRINVCVRKSDVVSRFGGDEFTVLLTNIESADDAENVANKLLFELSQKFMFDLEAYFISVSIGITMIPNDGSKAESLLINADQAMYEAKNNGRNRFRFYENFMQEKIQKRMTIAQTLREAIKENEFILYYQPIMHLRTGEIHKAEALIRWQKSDGTMVSPADFIPIAEESGSITQIGAWVFEEAVRQVQLWRNNYVSNFQISVNKSPVQFRNEGKRSLILDLMQAHNLSNDAIVVEITEGILMEQTSDVQNKLLEFEKRGVGVSLDDFGTGYSSLSYLKKFDIDYVKIDQSFIRNVVSDYNDQVLCEAILAMAHKMGILVIAEGVETQEQKEYLSSIECDYIQGYLISKPISAEEFEKKFFSN
ncbi:EAL domain-containing protein [bacterium]|nr:EAL domain-containing protein [bacterium]MBU1434781.1 EAL domain-containing protein [bacterium]MBU1502769.1 EAL domain-containing protein [bacterium]